MKDNFDKILSDKIKDVTENRDIPYNPEHWKMLLAKKNRNKKRVLFYWRVAGFLLISLFVGGLGKALFDNSEVDNSFKEELIIDAKNDSLRKDNLKTNEHIFITESDIDSLKIRKDDAIKTGIETTIAVSEPIYRTPPKETINGNENRITQKNLLKQKAENKNVALITAKEIESIDALKILEPVDIEDFLSETEKITQNINDIKTDSITIKKELIAEIDEDFSEEEISRKRIKYGMNLSPIFNSSQDSENSNVGFAGGVSIEIPISKRFDIYTGVIYTNQKFDVHDQTTYLSDQVSAKSNSQIISEEAIVNGIEIPLNIKYNFSIAKKNLFVSAGVSSTSNFKENIVSNYLVNGRIETNTQDSFGNNIVQFELVQSYEKVVTPTDSRNFNFASILNISLGIEVPINNNNRSIIIEPYFKYSLKPVTIQKVDYSSAGIFVRYNFSFKK